MDEKFQCASGRQSRWCKSSRLRWSRGAADIHGHKDTSFKGKKTEIPKEKHLYEKTTDQIGKKLKSEISLIK